MNSDDVLENDHDLLHKKYLEERDKRLRGDGNNQYIAIDESNPQYNEDPYVEPGFSRAPIIEDVDVMVLGAGFTGLLTAAALQKAGINDFRIIEKAGDFGGTWYWNRYPGCRCDVESYIYLPLLEEVGGMPTEKYIRASEIFEHAKKMGRAFNLYEKTCFQTGVTEIRWSEERARWIVRTDRGDTIHARFVCLGSGPLNRAKLPGIPGIETFKGKSFHTSRWDYHYTGGGEAGQMTGLADKRVAIIGTGATAVQCIPPLGESAQHLYVVQRTPAAIDARNNRPTDPDWWNCLQPGWQPRRMANFDGFLAGIPQTEDLVADGWTVTWAKFAEAARASEDAPSDHETISQLVDYEKMGSIRARIDRIVKDPVTAEALKPWYNWMCKRPLFHDGYYETFNRENVTLIDTQGKGLERITENAIVFDGKSYEVDCIIYASGFEVAVASSRLGRFELIGRNGVTLEQYWANGQRSLHGMFVRNFPNLGIVGGLKQASITWNIPLMLSKQVEHLVGVVKHCVDENVSAFNVSENAEQQWVNTIKEKSAIDRDFVRDCTPGYYNNEGSDFETSIWASSYGGGAFEYMGVLKDWRQSNLTKDLELNKN